VEAKCVEGFDFSHCRGIFEKVLDFWLAGSVAMDYVYGRALHVGMACPQEDGGILACIWIHALRSGRIRSLTAFEAYFELGPEDR